MYKLDLERAEETRDQIASIHWIIEKLREFQKQTNKQKNTYFCIIDYAEALDKLWKILQEMGIPDHLTRPPEKPVCRSRSNS